MFRELIKLPVMTMATVATLLLGMSAANADDTEIFKAGTTVSPNANVVFMVDTSGSMQWAPTDPNENTPKLQIVKDTFRNLIFDPDDNTPLNPDTNSYPAVNPKMEGLNFALMRFDDKSNSANQGGYFIHALKKLNDGSKKKFWEAISGLTAQGNTPLAETTYEAKLFFQGETPKFGEGTSPGTNVPGVKTGNIYKSPFSFDPATDNAELAQCTSTHLVILTDGMPTSDGDADTEIKALPGAADCAFASGSVDITKSCLPEVVKYLRDTDFIDDNLVPEDQNVTTHTIAFDLDATGTETFLKKVAEDYGGGMALSANNASELAKAIGDIVNKVVKSSPPFVSPGVSISSSNRFVHDRSIYFGMFKPEVSPDWIGNLKGYKVNDAGELVDFSEAENLVLGEKGKINDNVWSKWTTGAVADGSNVGAGGAASKIGLVRNVFTQNNSNGVVVFNASSVSQADLGAADTDERDAIINWAKGRTDDGSALRPNPVGDPLHTSPVVVNYGGTVGSIIFFSTNQGFLHAIDAESGVEKSAFIPRALLGNLKTFKDNNTSDEHPYGLDGNITVFIEDGNGDGAITNIDDDTALLIVGMRRGGSNYYALNIKNPASPTLQWQITGGSGNFTAMGQSWAKGIVTKLNIGSLNDPAQEEVVLISGGYDEQYDDLNTTPTSPKGNAIYAVGLRDGLIKWSAGSGSGTPTATHLPIQELVDAIPSDVSAIDTNSDGIADRLYAIDVKGRIFRIDFDSTYTDQSNNTTYRPTGELFADLQGGTRRFYYGVDVAYTITGFDRVLHLSVGSGHRAHPLALDSQDVFFSVWDKYAKIPLPGDYTALTVGDLTNVSTLPLDSETTIENGWYFSMAGGEKVLSQAASYAGYVFFTTYKPPTPPDTPTCIPVLGSGNLYAVKLNSSEALSNDRAIPLDATGIPPAPTFMALDQPTGDSGAVANPDGTGGGSGGSNTGSSDPFASKDIRRVLLVGTENPLEDDDEDKLNPSDTTKTYWQIVN